MTPQPPRRTLDFRDFDAVTRDLESLHSGGYERVGQWDLAQCCAHLTDWMRYPLEGFPRPPLPIRLLLWSMRTTIGPRELRKALQTRSLPASSPTAPESVHPAGLDEAEAVQRLRQTIDRFRSHVGEVLPSPFFGRMDYATATQLQLIHCAHHLSFLIPK